jgi:iron complex outermembrane receptor protein
VFGKIGTMYATHRGDFFSQALNLQANGDATLSQVKYPQNIQNTTGEAGFRGSFSTGFVKHTLVLSGSRLENTNAYAISFLSGHKTNIYSPTAITQWPTDPGDPVKSAEYALSSVAIADTMHAFDDRVLLILGTRRQRVKETDFNDGVGSTAYDQSAWTPMVGLVVKPLSNLSLYANVIEGLSQGTTVGVDYLNANEVFPPYKSKQIEFGIKWDAGSVTNTLSVFQIKQPGTLVDYSTSPLPTLRLNGEQRNRGIEWTMFGEIAHGVRVLGGVTYTQARLVKTQGGAQDGNEAPGVAPWDANLGVEWDTPWAPGLTLSGRVVNTSSQYVDSGNTIKLPSWTRLDIGARYATRISGKDVVFRAGIRNVFNKRYWEGVPASGYATVGAPRTFMLSATLDF